VYIGLYHELRMNIEVMSDSAVVFLVYALSLSLSLVSLRPAWSHALDPHRA